MSLWTPVTDQIRGRSMTSCDGTDRVGDAEGLPPVQTIRWRGEVDVSVAPMMLARALATPDRGSLVVDLSEVHFMDASGLGALVQGRFLLRAAGGDLLVRNPPAMVRLILEHFDFADMIESEPNYNSSSGAQEGFSILSPALPGHGKEAVACCDRPAEVATAVGLTLAEHALDNRARFATGRVLRDW